MNGTTGTDQSGIVKPSDDHFLSCTLAFFILLQHSHEEVENDFSDLPFCEVKIDSPALGISCQVNRLKCSENSLSKYSH